MVWNSIGARQASDLRTHLRTGGVAMGMQSFSGSPAMVEAMATAGLDFVTIDMEHSPTSLSDVAHMIRAADAASITPFVRVPEANPAELNRLLNLGVRGIVIPHASRDACYAALRATHYAPGGNRGSCPVVRSAGYRQTDWATFSQAANDTLFIIPLIEDAAAVDDFEALAAIDGIEVFFVGPFDLSIALGLPGQDFRHPDMAAALSRMVDIASNHNKHIMTTVGMSIDLAYARHLMTLGVRMLSFSADVLVFLEACRDIAGVARPTTSEDERG